LLDINIMLQYLFLQLELQQETMKEVQENFEKTKVELQEVKDQAALIDKKYNKAKKLIKEFQQRYYVKITKGFKFIELCYVYIIYILQHLFKYIDTIFC